LICFVFFFLFSSSSLVGFLFSRGINNYHTVTVGKN
jgi:hypothetical protein